jgi:hypothetical protein
MTTVGWIKVPQSNPPSAGQGILKPDAILGDAFALRGASATPGENGQMHLTLYWEALTDRAPVDATIFIHVIGPDGTLVDQSDTRPWDGQYPTFIWDQGERVQTDHLLAIGDASPADLIVHVGMYTLPGVTRLAAIQNGAPAPNNLVDLGKLDGLIAH